MNSRPELKIAWCSHDAAKYAVEHWHYSKCLPAGKLVKVGVWEGERFTGVVIFSRGSTPQIGKPYGLSQTEVCELTRVALRTHLHPVTKIVAKAIKMLKDFCPGMRLIVSYADPVQKHIGVIYQAGNWIYVGETEPQNMVIYQGKVMHRRSAISKFGSSKGMATTVRTRKYKYLMPLDRKMRREIKKLAKPYPHGIKKAHN